MTLPRSVDRHRDAAYVAMTAPRLFLESLDGLSFRPSHPFLPNRPPSITFFFVLWIFKIPSSEDQRSEDQSAIIIGDRDEPRFLNQPAQFDEFTRPRAAIHDPATMIQAL
jgi:hypothetical protein